tara:strand:+ start:37 stop:594 length:558 start_codon:yes stop_codon:yes gene_type:complete
MDATFKRSARMLLVLLMLFITSGVQAYDTLLLELGIAEGDADAEKIGFQARFALPYTWLATQKWQLESYLEAGVSYWDGEKGTSGHKDLFDFSITPIARLQRTQSATIWPFVEVGFGVHIHTADGIGDENFDIPFAFGTHIGMGFRIGANRNYEIMYKFRHLSNADIGDDNPGINFHNLQFGYHF